MTIKIDKKKDDLLASYAVGMLKDFYLKDHEKSPQEGFARAAKAWSKYKDEMDEGLSERLYSYVSNKWFMYASPVLSNAPNGESKKDKGMPISCFLVRSSLLCCGLVVSVLSVCLSVFCFFLSWGC